MTLYTDPKGRKLTDEAIARAWIRANPAKARALLAAPEKPSPFPADFGIELHEGEDGAVVAVPS